MRTLRKKLRNILPRVSAIISLLIIAGVVWAFLRSPPTSFLPGISFNEFNKAAMDIRLDQAKDMFQSGLVFLGALWGLIITRREEQVLVLEDRQELFMSGSATVLLIFSSACYLFYMDIVTSIYISAGGVAGEKLRENAKAVRNWIWSDSMFIEGPTKIDEILTIPDIFDPGVNYLFVGQFAFLIAGIVNAILAFVSAHKLKPNTLRG